MALYRPSSLEQSLILVNRATDLAWTHRRGSLVRRIEDGEPMEGGLPDLSFEGAQRRARLGSDIDGLLAQVDDEALPHEFALTSKLLRYYAAAWSKDAERYWLAVDPLDFMFYGPFAQTAYTGGFLFSYVNRGLAQFSFNKDGDGDRYLALLADLVRLLRQIHERTAGQAERDIRIHKAQLPAVRTLVTGLLAQAAASYPLQAARVATLPEGAALCAEVKRRVDRQVLPAFDALVSQLDADYERAAPNGVGMDKLPGGKSVYEALVRMHTTLDLTVEQAHAAGHARMARIEAQMGELRAELGFKGSAAEFSAHLRRQPGAVAKTPAEIGERMRRHKDRVEQRFDEFFAERSRYDYDLMRLPEALEGSMTWGYYAQPTKADPRGLYHYNGSNLDSQAVVGAASLVFHELVPGHHLHLTLQGANDNLPPLRKHAIVNAYAEGWAEYAATLAGDMGLYSDPYDRYGRLVFDAFLTSRLVVDTGLNALGWSWEQAKGYMREHTLCAEAEIESDTLRYSCGIPGQALAYKLGDEEILRLREDARKRLRGRFSYRDFHSAVLAAGALPFPALRWHLEKVLAA